MKLFKDYNSCHFIFHKEQSDISDLVPCNVISITVSIFTIAQVVLVSQLLAPGSCGFKSRCWHTARSQGQWVKEYRGAYEVLFRK